MVGVGASRKFRRSRRGLPAGLGHRSPPPVSIPHLTPKKRSSAWRGSPTSTPPSGTTSPAPEARRAASTTRVARLRRPTQKPYPVPRRRRRPFSLRGSRRSVVAKAARQAPVRPPMTSDGCGRAGTIRPRWKMMLHERRTSPVVHSTDALLSSASPFSQSLPRWSIPTAWLLESYRDSFP